MKAGPSRESTQIYVVVVFVLSCTLWVINIVHHVASINHLLLLFEV